MRRNLVCRKANPQRNLGNRFKRISEDQPIRNNGKRKGEKGLLKKRILNVIIASLFLIVGCSSPLSSESESYEATLSFDMRLNEDSNGYYHLTIDDGSWQTLHRVSGSITNEGFGVENFRVEWESNLYWYMGDSLGYFIRRTINSDGQYVSLDTSYAIGFEGHEVPTTNQVSYSNGYGEINNMIAPVRSMKGDTLYLTATWFSDTATWGIVLD